MPTGGERGKGRPATAPARSVRKKRTDGLAGLDKAEEQRVLRVVGELIRNRREDMDLTQADVGTLADVHRATIRAVEAGQSVEAKTRVSVLRALACSGMIHFDKESPTIVPILSSTLTKRVIDGIRHSDEDEDGDQGEEEDSLDGAFMLDAYRELMIYADPSLSLDGEEKQVPPTFEQFRNHLAIAPPQLRLLDTELHRIFRDEYPFPPAMGQIDVAGRVLDVYQGGSPRRRPPDTPVRKSEMQRIMDTGLSRPTQAYLMDWVAQRRAELEEQLSQELDRLLGLIDVVKGASDEYGKADE